MFFKTGRNGKSSFCKQTIIVGFVALFVFNIFLLIKCKSTSYKKDVEKVPVLIVEKDKDLKNKKIKFEPFYQPPKRFMPNKCQTAHSYEYLEEYKIEDHLIVHSQVKIDHRHVQPKDLLKFRDYVLEAWVKKFVITPKNISLYRHETSHAHIIYTGTVKSFQDLTNHNLSSRAVACLTNQNYACFQSPTNNVFTMILAPSSYHLSRKGTTIPKKIAPAEIFIIHEFIHWLSSVVDGKMDKDHENKKLWIKHDTKRSVQAIAYRLHLESMNPESVYRNITPMLNP
jgi:hypothetical protein